MATIAEEINDLKGRVNSAYDACVEKGATIPTVKNTANLPECIRSISGGSPSPTPPPASYEDVCKEVEFCQSKLIEQGGKSTYAGAWIGLRYSGIDYENFTLGSSNVVAVRTSDGAFYSYANDGASVTHHWDNSKDFDIPGIQTEHKFNWVIYYFSANSIVSNSSYLDCKKVVNIVYVFDMDLKFQSMSWGYEKNNSYGLSRQNDILQSFDFIDNHRCYGNTTDFSNFCSDCTSLTKLPDNLDTSSGTRFNNFCSNCYALTKLPDNLDTSKGTNFSSFCIYCQSLTKLPDNLDTSSSTDFNSFCANCYSLTKLPDNLDTSKVTNFNRFCQKCQSLTKLPDNLDTSSGTNFNSFCSDCCSLTNLPDSLDTGSGTNFNEFCVNCCSLTKLPDNLNTSSGTDFFFFCSNCYALTKLPDNLDTSSGTNFNSFCRYCYSLTKLPDNLDVSKGTNFNNFCFNCYALTKANIILPADQNITTLKASNKLTVASMRYIADHAPTTSGHTLTIGSTNIERANAYDPTIITTLTGKGWTVN